MKISGIYQIQSKKKPKRIYIGSAININRRWNSHLCKLNYNKHLNKKLQNHYNKYGKSDLQFSILLCFKKEDLIKNEQFFIDSYNPYFNIRKIAQNNLGLTHSDETKRKISLRNKGEKHTEETKKKISRSTKGKLKSEETRKRMSEYHKGRPLSKRHIERIREANKSKKGNTYRLGKFHSEESKQKISKSHIGKILSEETKQKMRGKRGKNKKKKTLSEEHKRKIGEAHKGLKYKLKIKCDEA